MIIVTMGALEFPMTETTEFLRFGIVSTTTSLFGCNEVGTVFSFARTTPFSITRMMFEVIVIVSLITIVAEIRVRQEPFEGIATIVMIVIFDEADDLGTKGCTVENDLMGRCERDDFDAVMG